MVKCLDCGRKVPLSKAVHLGSGVYLCRDCFCKGVGKRNPKSRNPKRVRYDRGSLDSAVRAAKRLDSDSNKYVFATAYGYTIADYPPFGPQRYIVVYPDGSTTMLQGNPTGLYESFHGAPPSKVRKLNAEFPKPRQKLLKVGRISQINYMPEPPSKHVGTEFYHYMGSNGIIKLKSNSILATDQEGENFYILKDKPSNRPRFTSRGILG